MKSKIWICVTFICLLFLSSIDGLSSKSKASAHLGSHSRALKDAMLKSKSARASQSHSSRTTSKEVPAGSDPLPPILTDSWGRFYETSQNRHPEVFKTNPAWLPGAYDVDDISKDKDGHETQIPEATLFWMILTEEGIHVLRSREDKLRDTFSFMPLEFIKSNEFKDLGTFSEGACFRIGATSVAGDGEGSWTMCFRTDTEKYEWFNFIKKLKATNVAESGTPAVEETEPGSTAYFPPHQVDSSFYGGSGISDSPEPPTVDDGAPDRDGRWIVLQTWSTCSLACGGGTQTMQRLCIPAQGKGKPCEGDALMTRACNEHPCQDAEFVVQETQQQTAPAIIRITPISARPQRYDECELKEGDMEMVREDMTEFPRPPRVPVRVVMNNRTISAFTGDSYDSLQNTFELNNLKPLTNYAEDKESCMIVADDTPNKRMVLCGLAVSSLSPSESKEEWIRDIQFFQHNCQTPIKVTLPDQDPEFAKKQSQVAMEYLEDRAHDDMEKEEATNESVLDDELLNTQNEANKAIEKELKYEAAAEREERLRSEQERNDLQQALEDAKEKMKCMDAAITDKELQGERNSYQLEVEKKKETIQQETKAKVDKRRAIIKRRMDIIADLHHRQNEALRKEISEMQTTMAGKMLEANKEGDMTLCGGTRTQEYRDSYCDSNLSESYKDNQECKTAEDFCYVCCETEFGTAQQDKIAQCDQQCTVATAPVESGDGQWVWVSDSNTVSQEQRDQ